MSETGLDDAAMQAIFDATCNWGRWGEDDELGALNYIDDAKRRQAAAEVISGEVVSCALEFPVTPGLQNPTPALHHMVVGGDDPCCATGPGLETTMDFIGIAFHGLASSHLDALCHVAVNGKLYNGVPVESVKSTGARQLSVMNCADGIVSRGVLLDIPRLRGQRWLNPAEMITPQELDAACAAQGVTIETGDVLLVYTGREPRTEGVENFDPDIVAMAGLHPRCAHWLHAAEIAAMGSDTVHDPLPQQLPLTRWNVPIHQCCLAGMGVFLLDNLALAALAQTCQRLQRWTFQFVVAPLKVVGGTGSPVNPLAIF